MVPCSHRRRPAGRPQYPPPSSPPTAVPAVPTAVPPPPSTPVASYPPYRRRRRRRRNRAACRCARSAVGDILDGSFQVIRRNPAGHARPVGDHRRALGRADRRAFQVWVDRAQTATTRLRRPERALGQLVGQLSGAFSLLVVSTLLGAILTGMLTAVVTEDVLGIRLTIGQAWQRARPRIWPLVGLALVTTMLEVLGLIPCLVLGVWLWGIWAVAVPAMMVEGTTIRGSLRPLEAAGRRACSGGSGASGRSARCSSASSAASSACRSRSSARIVGGGSTSATRHRADRRCILLTAIGSIISTTVTAPVRAGDRRAALRRPADAQGGPRPRAAAAGRAGDRAPRLTGLPLARSARPDQRRRRPPGRRRPNCAAPSITATTRASFSRVLRLDRRPARLGRQRHARPGSATLILLVLLVGVIVFAIVRAGRPRRLARQRAAGARSAGPGRATSTTAGCAAEFEQQGRLAEALREWLRATVASDRGARRARSAARTDGRRRRPRGRRGAAGDRAPTSTRSSTRSTQVWFGRRAATADDVAQRAPGRRRGRDRPDRPTPVAGADDRDDRDRGARHSRASDLATARLWLVLAVRRRGRRVLVAAITVARPLVGGAARSRARPAHDGSKALARLLGAPRHHGRRS